MRIYIRGVRLPDLTLHHYRSLGLQALLLVRRGAGCLAQLVVVGGRYSAVVIECKWMERGRGEGEARVRREGCLQARRRSQARQICRHGSASSRIPRWSLALRSQWARRRRPPQSSPRGWSGYRLSEHRLGTMSKASKSRRAHV